MSIQNINDAQDERLISKIDNKDYYADFIVYANLQNRDKKTPNFNGEQSTVRVHYQRVELASDQSLSPTPSGTMAPSLPTAEFYKPIYAELFKGIGDIEVNAHSPHRYDLTDWGEKSNFMGRLKITDVLPGNLQPEIFDLNSCKSETQDAVPVLVFSVPNWAATKIIAGKKDSMFVRNKQNLILYDCDINFDKNLDHVIISPNPTGNASIYLHAKKSNIVSEPLKTFSEQ